LQLGDAIDGLGDQKTADNVKTICTKIDDLIKRLNNAKGNAKEVN
jgi:hypothetical protein